MKWTIAPLELRHVAPVVDIHLRAFPSFFLTFLGPRFLREFYAAFLHEPTGIAFVAAEEQTGRILGSVVGTLHPGGFFATLLKRKWWVFCLASTAALWRKPGIALRLFRALCYRGTIPPGPPRSLLSSIAVAPEAQGIGLGRALLDHWLSEVRNRGSAGSYLTTDAEGNDAVNRFYQRAGWKLECTFVTPEGRKMHRYVLDFGNFKVNVREHSCHTDKLESA